MTQFQFVTTDDGSLSARIQTSEKPDGSETMHSLRGAFSETVYIYGTAITYAAEHQFAEPVLSMGLGLGYVELLASAIALKHGRKPAGESFEIIPELREHFVTWLRQASPKVRANDSVSTAAADTDLPTDFAHAYDSILERTAREIDQPAAEIKQALANAVATHQWLIREELTPNTTFDQKFGAICFDAFSSKSTPDLWSEDFLKSFLEKTAATECVLSTYACTGALKRALRAKNFDVRIREGFSSKRDSTFAVSQNETHN